MSGRRVGGIVWSVTGSVRQAVGAALGIPVAGVRVAGFVARQGRAAVRGVLLDHAGRALDRLVPAIMTQVLRRADPTALVISYVDLDRVVATIDVDAIARRIDLAALLAAAELPEIIRASTGTLASQGVHRTRMWAIAADEAVDRTRNRVRHRDVHAP